MRPSGIPLTWQPWPLAGSCTPPALETTGRSSLQEPMHLMILKSVVPTVSSLRGYYYTYLLKFSYPYILHILVHCSGKSILRSADIGVSRIECWGTLQKIKKFLRFHQDPYMSSSKQRVIGERCIYIPLVDRVRKRSRERG